MSLLFIIWSIALLFLIGIICYARLRTNVGRLLSDNAPRDMGDFIGRELHGIARMLHKRAMSARPHGIRALEHVIATGKKGHDIFIERVFGRIKIEKGTASSFFLKHIAEYKGKLRNTENDSSQ